MADVVVMGSGINGLVGAAVLARAGREVVVLEREDRLGGAVNTQDDHPAPGWTTDVFSCWHHLFVAGPAYAELGDELTRRGVVYRNTDVPAGGGAARRTPGTSGSNAASPRCTWPCRSHRAGLPGR